MTGRAKSQAALRAHLTYISRSSTLFLEDRDGGWLTTREEVLERARNWEDTARLDSNPSAHFPLSLSMVFSAPEGSDPLGVRKAASTLAADVFGRVRDYLFVLHTDTPNPHVHLTLQGRGDDGRGPRLSLGELIGLRQLFAERLRERGVEAQATLRQERGLTRESEHDGLYRLRKSAEAGRTPPAKLIRDAYIDAARAAFLGQTQPTPWEEKMIERQTRVRGLYLAEAALLRRSKHADDRALGEKVEAFVREMPAPDFRRLAFARELRAARETKSREPALVETGLSRELQR